MPVSNQLRVQLLLLQLRGPRWMAYCTVTSVHCARGLGLSLGASLDRAMSGVVWSGASVGIACDVRLCVCIDVCVYL